MPTATRRANTRATYDTTTAIDHNAANAWSIHIEHGNPARRRETKHEDRGANCNVDGVNEPLESKFKSTLAHATLVSPTTARRVRSAANSAAKRAVTAQNEAIPGVTVQRT
jgi:hypothetical protein